MDYNLKDQISSEETELGSQTVENSASSPKQERLLFTVDGSSKCIDRREVSFVYPPDLPFDIQMPQTNSRTIFARGWTTFEDSDGSEFEEPKTLRVTVRVDIPANTEADVKLFGDRAEYSLPYVANIVYDDGSKEEITEGVMECDVQLQNFSAEVDGNMDYEIETQFE